MKEVPEASLLHRAHRLKLLKIPNYPYICSIKEVVWKAIKNTSISVIYVFVLLFVENRPSSYGPI